MLDGIQHLLELQRLDSEIARRREVLEAQPAKRKQLEESSAAAQVKLAEAREGLKGAEMTQRQAEASMKDQEALLQKLETQQLQVKDNTAYTALLSEMEHAKEAISACETQILEGMESVEAAGERVREAEGVEATARTEQETRIAEFDASKGKLEAELTGLVGEREAVEPNLDGAMLAAYEKVAKRKSPALALVKNEMCEGCRVGIPAQNFIEILKGEKIITCGNCNRILLHPDMVSSVEPQAAG